MTDDVAGSGSIYQAVPTGAYFFKALSLAERAVIAVVMLAVADAGARGAVWSAVGIAAATVLPCAALRPHAAGDGNRLELKSRLYNLGTVAGGVVLNYLVGRCRLPVYRPVLIAPPGISA